MQNNQKYLYTLKQGEKFIQNNKIHTVYSQANNMTEVFRDGRFFAYPNWNGKESVKVNMYVPQFV